MKARKDHKRWQAGVVWLVRLVLAALWVPVAVDKLWNLTEFHSTLLRQPFPDGWADILFWLLPLLELLAAVLIAWPHYEKPHVKPFPTSRDFASLNRPPVGQQRPARSGAVASPTLHPGLALSTFLMLAFTLFILFGVLGWYDKRPCGCGSVISGLSWEQHLWFNIAFLLISILGLWLTRKSKPKNPSPRLAFRRQEESQYTHAPYSKKGYRLFKKMFPRKFALFRRRAVSHSPCRWLTSKKYPAARARIPRQRPDIQTAFQKSNF